MVADRKLGNRRVAASGRAGTKKRWIEPRQTAETIRYLALRMFRHEIFTSGPFIPILNRICGNWKPIPLP
jgi:hypothetical protein